LVTIVVLNDTEAPEWMRLYNAGAGARASIRLIAHRDRTFREAFRIFSGTPCSRSGREPQYAAARRLLEEGLAPIWRIAHPPAATSRRSLQACIASLPLRRVLINRHGNRCPLNLHKRRKSGHFQTAVSWRQRTKRIRSRRSWPERRRLHCRIWTGLMSARCNLFATACRAAGLISERRRARPNWWCPLLRTARSS
jgi:hypothetical protein